MKKLKKLKKLKLSKNIVWNSLVVLRGDKFVVCRSTKTRPAGVALQDRNIKMLHFDGTKTKHFIPEGIQYYGACDIS